MAESLSHFNLFPVRAETPRRSHTDFKMAIWTSYHVVSLSLFDWCEILIIVGSGNNCNIKYESQHYVEFARVL